MSNKANSFVIFEKNLVEFANCCYVNYGMNTLKSFTFKAILKFYHNYLETMYPLFSFGSLPTNIEHTKS